MPSTAIKVPSDLAAQGKEEPSMRTYATGSLDMSSPRSTIIPLNSPFLTLPSDLTINDLTLVACTSFPVVVSFSHFFLFYRIICYLWSLVNYCFLSFCHRGMNTPEGREWVRPAVSSVPAPTGVWWLLNEEGWVSESVNEWITLMTLSSEQHREVGIIIPLSKWTSRSYWDQRK